jgi:hypothetical protein
MSSIQTHRFNWLPQRSAWQQMQSWRAKRAAAVQKYLDNMDTVSTSMGNALQNNITQSATNAAQAALSRIQNSAKATSAKLTSQIDSAQSVIDQAQSSSSPLSSSSSASASAGSSVLDVQT